MPAETVFHCLGPRSKSETSPVIPSTQPNQVGGTDSHQSPRKNATPLPTCNRPKVFHRPWKRSESSSLFLSDHGESPSLWGMMGSGYFFGPVLENRWSKTSPDLRSPLKLQINPHWETTNEMVCLNPVKVGKYGCVTPNCGRSPKIIQNPVCYPSLSHWRFHLWGPSLISLPSFEPKGDNSSQSRQPWRQSVWWEATLGAALADFSVKSWRDLVDIMWIQLNPRPTTPPEEWLAVVRPNLNPQKASGYLRSNYFQLDEKSESNLPNKYVLYVYIYIYG